MIQKSLTPTAIRSTDGGAAGVSGPPHADHRRLGVPFRIPGRRGVHPLEHCEGLDARGLAGVQEAPQRLTKNLLLHTFKSLLPMDLCLIPFMRKMISLY